MTEQDYYRVLTERIVAALEGETLCPDQETDTDDQVAERLPSLVGRLSQRLSKAEKEKSDPDHWDKSN